MLTRVDLADLNPSVTEPSSIAWVAFAGEPIDAINTAALLANIVCTIVPINFTAGARESVRTFTGEGVNRVMANSVVVTWVRGAVVDVLFTVLTTIPGRAIALVSLGIYKESKV